VLNPQGEENEMILCNIFIEQCETLRSVQKNKNKLNILNKNSVFSMNYDQDPVNRLKIENTKLLEKVKQIQENIDILNNKFQDAQNQTKSFENLSEEKSTRIANMHEEHENLRLNLQKYETELTGRISQAESKKLTSDND